MGNSPSKSNNVTSSGAGSSMTSDAIDDPPDDSPGWRGKRSQQQSDFTTFDSILASTDNNISRGGSLSKPRPTPPRRHRLGENTSPQTGSSISSASLSPNNASVGGGANNPSSSLSSSGGGGNSPGGGKQQKSTFVVNEFIKRLLSARNQPSSQKQFCLSSAEIRTICSVAIAVLLSQPVFLELGTPVKVVGDVHGQFADLMHIFDMCGMPPKANYLFLGDYVDRGKQSLETIMLLLCLKIKYPENVFLLRGNHECASVTKVYGFYDECKRRCSVKVWKTIVDVFNALPIAATIGGKIFCVHGGLSPTLSSLNEIKLIQRPTDVPDTGLISDLLWSDPDQSVQTWGDNDRGVSYCFGRPVVDKFCRKFGFDLIARGHMVVEDGYEFFADRKLVTVFSAPNYCGEFSNWGAIMSVSKDLLCSFDLLKPNNNTNSPSQQQQRSQQSSSPPPPPLK